MRRAEPVEDVGKRPNPHWRIATVQPLGDGGLSIAVGDCVDEWVGEAVKLYRPLEYTALGVILDHQLIAGVAFYAYNGPDIAIAMRGTNRRWSTRSVLFHIFHYVFEQLGCKRASMVLPAHDLRAREFAERLGFSIEGLHPCAWPDGSDAISYGLLRRDCRWIGNLNG